MQVGRAYFKENLSLHILIENFLLTYFYPLFIHKHFRWFCLVIDTSNAFLQPNVLMTFFLVFYT